MCTPTRGQLLTGKDALHNGASIVCSGYSFVYPDILLMPEILKESGYKTGIFGKWHLGDNYPFRPMDRGFDYSVWHKGWGVSSVPDYWNNDYFDDYYWRNNTLEQFDGYCTDIWFTEAMKWIEDCHRRGKPFFAYIPTNAPHGPLYVDDTYRAPYKELNHGLASFFGMIANIDENMGRLDSMMESSGIKNNTILIFMTDNGGTAGVNYYNAGMREGKTSLYEGGHRVPCIIQWPDGKLHGEINEMIQVQDILPIILDFCNIKNNYKFDGVSIADVLKGKKQNHLKSRMGIVQYGRQPWNLLELPVKYDACVMWNKWRLVNNTELYDIEKDPGQTTNLASEKPDIV
jgi:arylsulfatase A-like enzyme